uniref:VWFA domain-containing protein n=1 Tax=Acrobeloides nanus TaxID=290746 RepID=A0A914EIJ6_9BILA
MKLLLLISVALLGSVNCACPASLEADVVLLLDTSTAVDKSSYDSLSNTLVQSLGSCNISAHGVSETGVRLAVIDVPGDSWMTPLVTASFSTITSTNLLQKSLANAWPDPQFDPPQATGQTLLSQAVNTANSDNFRNQGYRSSETNHLIIYVTTSSSPNQDAITAAQTVRSSNSYGFLALSYNGNGANTNALTSFVGGANCLLSANNQNDLNGLGDQLLNLINQASQNGGKYC